MIIAIRLCRSLRVGRSWSLSEIAILRQLTAGAPIRRVLFRLQAKEILDSKVTFSAWKQACDDFESAPFCRHPKNDGSGKVVPPNTLNISVRDGRSARLKKPCW